MGPELGGEARELEAVGGGAGQHQIPQQTGQALEHGGGLPAPLQQVAAGLEQGQGFAGGQGSRQPQQLLLRYGAK